MTLTTILQFPSPIRWHQMGEGQGEGFFSQFPIFSVRLIPLYAKLFLDLTLGARELITNALDSTASLESKSSAPHFPL